MAQPRLSGRQESGFPDHSETQREKKERTEEERPWRKENWKARVRMHRDYQERAGRLR